MNNLMKITAVLALAILSGCVGSINAGDIGTGGNNSDNGDNGGIARNTITANSTELEILLSKVNNRKNIVSSTSVRTDNSISRRSDSVFIGDGDGQFVMTVNGRRYVFSETEEIAQSHVAFNSERDSYVVRIERDDLVNALDPSTPKDYLLFSYVASGDTFGSIGEFVTGIQTPLNNIPTTASAIYSGRAYVGALNGDVLPSIAVPFGVDGDMTMNVDFAQKTISGEMTNLTEFDKIINIPSGSTITFNQTRFEADGSYDGTVTLSSGVRNVFGIRTVTGAVYRGATYGQNAESVAGILEFNGSTGTINNYYAGGGFYADK